MAIQNPKMAESRVSAQQNQFTAQLVVHDLQASVDFYKKAFGFQELSKEEAINPPNVNWDQVRVMKCNDLPFLLISEKASNDLKGYQAKSPMSLNTLSPTIITILCTNLQKMYEQAINAGAKPIQAPHRTGAGATTFLVAGTENYVWRFIDNFSDLSQAL